MVDINILAQIGICSEFIGESGERSDVSVVISPIKVETTSEDKIKIITGCNMWKSCQNEGCYYSIASRKAKTKAPGER